MFSENLPSKASATKHMKRILRKGAPLDAFDRQLVVEVFRRHYRYEQEAMAGTQVEEPILFPQRGHWAFGFPRANGQSYWNPSYKTAIKGQMGPRPADQARDAMWRDIRPQMVRFKERQLAGRDILDPYTAEALSKENCEADHDSAFFTFAGLIDAWLECKDLTLSGLKVVDNPNTGYHTLKDFELRESWQHFHKRKAVLRLLSKGSHEEVTRRQHR